MPRGMRAFHLALLLLLSVSPPASDALSTQVPPRRASSSSAPSRRPRPAPLPEPSAGDVPGAGQTAVILNTNARSVSPALAPVAESVFGRGNVFVTTTAEEARDAASAVVSGGYSLVVPVGGDGTLSSMINYMCDEIMSRDGASVEESIGRMPAVGYIPLGTGNGLGFVVGCSVRAGLFGGKRRRMRRARKVMEQLRDVGDHIAAEGKEECHIVEMPVLEVTQHYKDDLPQRKGDLCFFAGVGFDSLMLNDFKDIKAWSARTGFLKRSLSSVAGYCVALVVKTLPKCIVHGRHKINVEVTTRDVGALWIDHRRGDFAEPAVRGGNAVGGGGGGGGDAGEGGGDVKPGKLLYSGTTGILAAGTSPFYGGGLRLFPYARLYPDKMHLRLGRINPLVGFVNIPKIFEGSYREKSDSDFGCLDFIGDDFEVEVRSKDEQKGFPFQHSGESVGYLERFRLRVVKEKVKFVSLLERRVVVDE